MKLNRSSENGQAMVLLVLAMVAMLGFTALAVDGGMVYSDRRNAQNGGDAASLSGGGAAALSLENSHVTYLSPLWNSCPNSSGAIAAALAIAESTAINRADDNHYTIDADISDNNGVDAVCGNVFNGSWTDKYIDVKTKITADTKTAFAHLFYPGPLRNTVEAITRIRPKTPAAYGRAIVGVNEDPDCDGNQNGVVFNGNIDVDVVGGGVFSNGCLRGNGTSLDVDVTNGGIVHVGELTTQHEGTFDPAPSPGSPVMTPDMYILPPPDCSQVAHYGSPSNAYRTHAEGVIPAGNYNGIKASGDLQLTAGGLYCLYDDFDVGNSNLSIDSSNGKSGVTIYLLDGGFNTGGNGSVVLNAPPETPDPSPAVPGLLIYLAVGNTSEIDLSGTSDSSFEGTILAPDGDIKISGTPEHTPTFSTQLVGKNVLVTGTADIEIHFDPKKAAQVPAKLELFK